MRPPDEVKVEHVRQWLAKAEEDVGVARLLFHEDTPYLATVGFHAQQAAEKYLKAFLVWCQVEFPKTHDLDKLLALVPGRENALVESLGDISVLTDYGVDFRYPGDQREISRSEARMAVELAEKVREAILEFLPDHLKPTS
jgi:HEPN domain-containing protein